VRRHQWAEGQRLVAARNDREAEKHLSQALALSHTRAHRAEVSLSLAQTRHRLRQFVAAEEAAHIAYEEAMGYAQRWEAAQCLAEVQAAQGRLREGVETLHSMELAERQRAQPDLRRLAKASHDRGRMLLESGDYAPARGALAEAVRLAEGVWGGESVELAFAVADLGRWHTEMGRHEEGVAMMGRAHGIFRTAMGHHSREATYSLQSLALSLEAAGRSEDAAVQFERFVAAAEQQVGGDQNALLEAKIRLAALYVQVGRIAAARDVLKQVILTLERAPGEGLWVALQIMATAEEQSGYPDEAKRLRSKAAKLRLNRDSAMGKSTGLAALPGRK
jgi:tetratricopeptide (TPR) repeat protein